MFELTHQINTAQNKRHRNCLQCVDYSVSPHSTVQIDKTMLENLTDLALILLKTFKPNMMQNKDRDKNSSSKKKLKLTDNPAFIGNTYVKSPYLAFINSTQKIDTFVKHTII